MSALDLDALERLAQRCVAASEKLDAATNAYARWDAEQEALAPHEDLGLHGAEVVALITRLRAAEARAAWQPIETAGWTCQDEGEFELHTHQADAIAEHFEVHDIDPADESATITVYEHAVIPHEVNVLAWVREHEPEWLPAAPEAP